MESEMHYEYRITSDSEKCKDDRISIHAYEYGTRFMLEFCQHRLDFDASWAEVQFVRVDDDGTFEQLRRLRLD